MTLRWLTPSTALLIILTTSGFCSPSQATAESPAIGSSASPQDQGATATSISGNWQISWTGRRGPTQATLQLTQNGSKLSGSIEAERGTVRVSGTVNGDQVSFTAKMPKRTLTFSGTVAGNKMSGTTAQGSPWTATRQ
jgi:hypothetical protein